MKIFVAHSSGYDYKNELYIPLRNSPLSEEHEIFLPKEKSETEVITRDIIRDSNVVVAEVSYPSTGQGIELGWADIFNVPIICMYKNGSKISGSLSKLTDKFLIYHDSAEMIQLLTTELEKIKNV